MDSDAHLVEVVAVTRSLTAHCRLPSLEAK